jgi:hypothetical protein
MKTQKRTAANDPNFCPIRAKKMAKIFHSLCPVLDNLAARWADEKEYEDIADYRKVIESELVAMNATDVEITKMIRRPFGFECNFMGAKYRLTCNSRACEYGRIG